MTRKERCDRRVSIIADIGRNESVQCVALRYGVSERYIAEILRTQDRNTKCIEQLTNQASRIESILSAVRSGKTALSVSKEFDVCKEYIVQLCHNAGVSVPDVFEKNKVIRRQEEIVSAVESGEAIDSVSLRYGLTRNYVWSVCKKRSVKMPGIVTREDRIKRLGNVINGIKSGQTVNAVASDNKLSINTVIRMCTKNGVSVAGKIDGTKLKRNDLMSTNELLEWAKTQCLIGNHGCVVWQRCTVHGYPSTVHNKKSVRLHRLMCEKKAGRKLKTKELVCHTCDNRACINPDHLFIGTANDNHADMVSKGRRAVFKGSKNGQSKLIESDILEIRDLRIYGFFQHEIAKMYGVSQGAIHQIDTGGRWSHVVRK